MPMNRSVLIVGGSGFLGRHVADALLADGRPVFATFRPRHAAPQTGAISWIPCDFADDDPHRSWPLNCETIVFLAQSRRHREFPEGNADVFDTNLAGLMRTMEFARRSGVRRFVYLSTGSVYGRAANPQAESAPIDVASAAQSFYAATKLSGELLLRSYARLMCVATLRLFVPYGLGQNADMLMPQLVSKVEKGLPILLNPPDGLRANPIAAEDVGEAVRRCLTLDESVTLNVAGPDEWTLRGIGETIGRVLGRPVAFAEQQGQAPNLVGDIRSMTAALRWRPPTDLETGLRRWLAKCRTPLG